MRRETNGPLLSAVFVDYDNIYLSLRRKSEEAAKRFSKDAAVWLREIESGRLLTPTNTPTTDIRRRMVMNRCYGNPVPRRSSHDNSTDMHSFPFVRHHFLRSGFEVIDCPPLTAQLKNSSDIRMVMDVRDFLTHDTYFDEFVILSGDADFTPVLHRLRAHARRTVIFANDYTATPYTAICDGEVREADLIRLLVDGQIEQNGVPQLASNNELVAARSEIIAEVTAHVRATGQPVPLEVLAERAVRLLGHERTAGSGWAGAGSFRELLLDGLPSDVRLTDEPPYLAYLADTKPQPALTREAPVAQRREVPRTMMPAAPSQPAQQQPAQSYAGYAEQRAPQAAPANRAQVPVFGSGANGHPAPRGRAPMLETQPSAPIADGHDHADEQQTAHAMMQAPLRSPVSAGMQAPVGTHVTTQVAASQNYPAARPTFANVPMAPAPQQPVAAPTVASPVRTSSAPTKSAGRSPAAAATALQQSVTRIYEACQAPPLSPPDYRRLFEAMAAEITENGLQGSQTLANVQARALATGLQIQRDDVRFVLDVVSEPDPWFEQGASANLFAGRFRNFVVARCRSQGLSLSVEELDLIEAWFTGGPETAAPRATGPEQRTRETPSQTTARPAPSADWWTNEATVQGQQAPTTDDEFPRIVRSRLRG